MKTFSRIIAATVLLLCFHAVMAEVIFNDYFTDKTLRFDFLFAGTWQETHIYPVQMKEEPSWAGSRINLIDSSGYGNFRYSILDAATGTLLFRKGFSALFQEWQTTPEARKTGRAYYQAVFSPFPKNKVILKIDTRNRSGEFQALYETEINPGDYFILRETPAGFDKTVIQSNGLPENKVDLVFLAEGYTAGEKEKFIADVKRMRDDLFGVLPYSANRDKFNITALWTPSDEEGMDIPGKGVYRNTRFNSTFYTFDLDRYLTTSDMKSVYDASGGVPWDFAVVLVNTQRYGGGGFYNLLTVCTSDNKLTPKVFVHEFSHAFAGLADEYYSSSVAYEDFYNLKAEPWEPNITTLVNFAAKWKSMVADSTPVPTPRTPEYESVTGVFEGGGYVAKGIYSPRQDCLMKSNDNWDFCPVCRAAIQKTIEWYAK